MGWASMSVVTNSWWLAYGLSSRNWAIVPVSIVSVVGYLLVVAAIVRFGERSGPTFGRVDWAALAAVVAVPMLVLAFGGLAPLGVSLGMIYGLQLAPAVRGVYLSDDLRGVSAGTWLAAWAEAALWGALGVEHGDPGLVALAVTGLVMSSALLARLTLWNVAARRQPAVGLASVS